MIFNKKLLTLDGEIMTKKTLVLLFMIGFSVSIQADSISIEKIESVGKQIIRIGEIFNPRSKKSPTPVNNNHDSGNAFQHAPVPNIAGMGYTAARTLLLENGWQPFNTIHWSDESSLDAQAQILREKGFYEVKYCGIAGVTPCEMLFKDIYGNGLIVRTEGELIDDYDIGVQYIRVYSPSEFDEVLSSEGY